MQIASSLLRRCPPAAPSAALVALGASLGALAHASLTELGVEGESAAAAPDVAPQPLPKEAGGLECKMRAKYEKKIAKLRKEGINKVHWPAAEKEMLGLAPRLWMETLDQHHRYASLLHDYWRRWQLSDTHHSFFPWLDSGQGALIDLPHAPRRLLDEWRVLYLQRCEQPLFHVIIEEGTGRFLWEADGMPVNLPPVRPILLDAPKGPQEIASATAAATAAAVRANSTDLIKMRRTASSPVLEATGRERAVAALLEPAVARAQLRDRLLEDARAQVTAAISAGELPKKSRMVEIAQPLFDEDLLCQLRDPFFTDRLDAARTPQGHAYLRHMTELPTEMLPNKTWEDFLQAIDHDQGKFMGRPLNAGADMLEGKGIFVLDSFGPLYCGVKIRGVFHHSSFVRGHAVRVAGGLRIEDGWLKALSPHSGHYQPSQEMVEEMMEEWRKKGVDFSLVKVSSYMK